MQNGTFDLTELTLLTEHLDPGAAATTFAGNDTAPFEPGMGTSDSSSSV